MGESILSRRGGGEGKPNIFLQTTQPSSAKGGLWVKTGLKKYVFDAAAVPSGSVYNVGAASNQISIPAIYNGVIYFVPYSTASTKYFVAYSVQSGISTNKASFVYAMYSQSLLYAYNGIVYLAFGMKSGSSERDVVEKYSIASDTWTSVPTPKILRSHSGCVGNGSNIVIVNNNNQDYFIWDMVANSISNTQLTKGIACGFDGDNVYSFGLDYNRGYKVNLKTNITTQLASMPVNSDVSNQWYSSGLGIFGGVVYFQVKLSNSGSSYEIYGYSISSNAYTKVYAWSTQLTYCANLLYQGTVYLCGRFETTVNALAITGNHTAADTIVIEPGISKNIARISSTKEGNLDLPIDGVYTVQSGQLKPVASYVSTGGAWTAVKY